MEVSTVVALLAEGVDRNCFDYDNDTAMGVALLAEGVDRNSDVEMTAEGETMSPSSRRAWIEIRTST